jgi:hypothetical protein
LANAAFFALFSFSPDISFPACAQAYLVIHSRKRESADKNQAEDSALRTDCLLRVTVAPASRLGQNAALLCCKPAYASLIRCNADFQIKVFSECLQRSGFAKPYR